MFNITLGSHLKVKNKINKLSQLQVFIVSSTLCHILRSFWICLWKYIFCWYFSDTFLTGFSVLGVGRRLSQSCDRLFLSIYTLRQFCSISLACNPALIFLQAGHMLYFTRVQPACPPSYIHCLMLPLFSFIPRWQRGLHGSCTMLQMLCIELSHWVRECRSAWSSPRNVYCGTGLTSSYSYSSIKPSQGMQPHPSHKQWSVWGASFRYCAGTLWERFVWA